ncbi:MAG: tetratricopeptide repeat protein [Acidobacteriota bacterium]|nr:tetratricopeptide repeat protein [Acidobacteriota bacterium]
MSLLRKSLSILPLGLIFAVTGWGQTGAFEGTVKSADGKPLVGAQVKLERQDVKGNYAVKTDKKGHYFYGGLPLGNYKISVLVDGQEKDARNGVRTKVGETADISFDLSAAAAGPPAVDESGRALSAAEKAENEKKNKEQVAAMAKNKALNDAFNAGKTAAAANQWDAAIDGFTKASEVDASQHVVWGNLADSYVSRAKAAPATKDADLVKAADAYQKAIAISPNDAAYHNNYALVLGQQKKFDEAQAELTKAAQIDPTGAGKFYYNLGAVYVNTGNLDPAAAAFKKAIDLDPNYAEAYFQYGLSLIGKATIENGKTVAPPGTAEAFQKYLDLTPNGPNAETAKAMMASMGAAVQTNFKAAPAQQKKKQ